MTYSYRMLAYRDGTLVVDLEKTIESDTLAANSGGKVGREAFLELLNHWNKQGAMVNLSSMKYVYIAM